jgi:hypothetical protein
MASAWPHGDRPLRAEENPGMPHKLTFAAYRDLALARLYEAETDGYSGRCDIAKLMFDLERHVPEQWAWDTAFYLVEHGLAIDLVSSGSPEVQLNANGRLRAEAGAGIIGAYQDSTQIVLISGDANQVAVGHGQSVVQSVRGDFSKEEVEGLLDEAEARIADDANLTGSERTDALRDVESMRAQLAKTSPNRDVLTTLVAGLGGLASVADIVDKIRSAL